MNYSVAKLLSVIAERIVSKPLLPSYITIPVRSDGRPPRAPMRRVPRTR